MKRILRFIAIGLIIAIPVMDTRPAYAASATLSLSPASGSVSQGSELVVTVRMNSGGEPVNGVQANLTYPANLLDFIRIGSTSAFSVVAENSGGGGSVQIGRGALPAVSGSQSVATVRFRAKVNAGTATINFADSSQVVSGNSNQNILTGKSGGNYTLKPPAAPTPAAPQAPKDTIPPTITAVKAGEPKLNSITIAWTTSEPTTSEISYGLTNAYGLTATDNNLTTDHKVVISTPNLIPGTTYNYMVKSIDAAGNAATSKNGTFTTLGLTLIAKVVNKDNKPVSGAKVTFGDKSATTGKNGEARLNGLALGKQTGIVEYKDNKTAVQANVKSLDPNKPDTATFKIATPGTPLWVYGLVIGALAAIAALVIARGKTGGGGFGNFKSRLKPGPSKEASVPPNKSQAEPAVIRPSINRGPSQ